MVATDSGAVPAVRRLWTQFFIACVFSLAVMRPGRAIEIERVVAPFAAASRAIEAAQTDLVVVDTPPVLFAEDLVRNDPYLRNRPLILDLGNLDEAACGNCVPTIPLAFSGSARPRPCTSPRTRCSNRRFARSWPLLAAESRLLCRDGDRARLDDAVVSMSPERSARPSYVTLGKYQLRLPIVGAGLAKGSVEDMIAKLLGHQSSVGRKTLFGAVDVLVVLTAAAVAFGLVVRVGVGGDQPLWLDETFTGAIAASGSFREVAHQAYEDVNAPLYYFVAHAWSLVAGLSNQALRFPSVAVGCVTPFLCLLPTPGLSRRARLAWCALVAVWAPGLSFAQEARCYALLLALSIGATICFIRLLDRPSVRRAALWAGVGCLAILTHYHALFLIGAQGLVYLATCRRRAWSTAPAFVVFAPAFVWLAYHSGRIADFAAPNVAWYRSLTADNLLELLIYASGSLAVPLLLFGLALLTFAVRLTGGRVVAADDMVASSRARRYAWFAVFCSVAAALVVVLLGPSSGRVSFPAT